VKAALIASLLLLGSCGSGGAPDIQIADAWARGTVAGQSVTAAYATIANRGSGSDRLVGISAHAPLSAMLHETSTSGGVSSMRPLDGLDIPAGETVWLQPGGGHVMISGLTAPLKQGDTIKLTLRFGRSGDKVVDFKIAPALGEMKH
jgi:copper(I)-binding protein